MELHLDITPVPKGRPRFTLKGRAYTPQRTKIYENELANLIAEQNPKKLEGAIKLEIVFYIPKPRSVKRKYPTVRPDLDNFLKAFKDAANGILWNDDSQVITVTASKQYATEGAIYVKTKEIK